MKNINEIKVVFIIECLVISHILCLATAVLTLGSKF